MLKAIEGKKKFILLAGLKIIYVIVAIDAGKENIGCVIDDDVRYVLKEMEKCDAIILGSPCYFKSVSTQLKMLMDRSVSLYRGDKGILRNKVGAVIVTHDVHGWGGALVV